MVTTCIPDRYIHVLLVLMVLKLFYPSLSSSSWPPTRHFTFQRISSCLYLTWVKCSTIWPNVMKAINDMGGIRAYDHLVGVRDSEPLQQKRVYHKANANFMRKGCSWQPNSFTKACTTWQQIIHANWILTIVVHI